jgi:hypothetical protein
MSGIASLARGAISGARAGRGGAAAGRAAGASRASRLRTAAGARGSSLRAAAGARGSRLAGATLGSRTKALGTFGTALFGLGMYEFYETIVSPMEKMGSCLEDPLNTENGNAILGFINSDCSTFIIPTIIIILTLGVILVIITRDKHDKAWGASLGSSINAIDSAHGKGIYGKTGEHPKGLDLKYSDPGTYEPPDLDYKFGGGGKKLMNVNILLVIFIGYLLFYLYERYSEMINKEKELNKFRRN